MTLSPNVTSGNNSKKILPQRSVVTQGGAAKLRLTWRTEETSLTGHPYRAATQRPRVAPGGNPGSYRFRATPAANAANRKHPFGNASLLQKNTAPRHVYPLPSHPRRIGCTPWKRMILSPNVTSGNNSKKILPQRSVVTQGGAAKLRLTWRTEETSLTGHPYRAATQRPRVAPGGNPGSYRFRAYPAANAANRKHPFGNASLLQKNTAPRHNHPLPPPSPLHSNPPSQPLANPSRPWCPFVDNSFYSLSDPSASSPPHDSGTPGKSHRRGLSLRNPNA